MEGIDNCFPFIKMPARPPKPRSKGLNIISDRSLSKRQAEDLMETSAEIIDYMKFTDHTANLARHNRATFQAKMEIYHAHQVKTFTGGIVFEVAVLQDQVRPVMETLKSLGFDGVEISEDVIPTLKPEVRLSYIEMARDLGLEAFTEVGKKDPTAPLDPQEAIDYIHRDIETGARKVTIENSDINLLMQSDPTPLKGIVEAVGIDKVVFEIGPAGWPEVAIWVMRTFGGLEVNLENFDPDRLPFVDGMRRGMERPVNYEFLSVYGGKVR